MKRYRILSMCMLIVFSIVGFIFLFYADGVLEFFNSIARATGMKQSPVCGTDFYLILTAGYMYVVSVLAYMMFKHPDNPVFPLLLTHGKLASSLLSFGFFFLHQPYPIYFVNGVVDGLIGFTVLLCYLRMKKNQS